MAESQDDGRNNCKDFVRLMFVGSPLLDISAKCTQDLLQKYGLKSDDCVRAKPEHDALFKSLFDEPSAQLSAGGTAQNSARISKWVLGEKAHVSFAGCVGCDNFSTWMADKLLSENIQPLYVYHPTASTGVCACLLASERERSMCTRHGASAEFRAQHLMREDIRSKIEKADCLFVAGYFLVHSPDAVFRLCEMSTPSQLFVLSLAAEYVCRDHTQDLLKVLPRANLILGNEVEVKTFAIAMGAEDSVSVEDAVGVISAHCGPDGTQPRIVVVSRGADPVVVVEDSHAARHYEVPSNVRVVDSVGCGDALAGAFLAVYALTRDTELAVQVGIRAAVQIVQTPGCDPPAMKIFDSPNKKIID